MKKKQIKLKYPLDENGLDYFKHITDTSDDVKECLKDLYSSPKTKLSNIDEKQEYTFKIVDEFLDKKDILDNWVLIKYITDKFRHSRDIESNKLKQEIYSVLVSKLEDALCSSNDVIVNYLAK